ncbi:beta-lactamase [Leptospira broomii serovar Hurstbridge str. 5399]|uniref:Beta-lactamase n=2 Tax=Leptospira broomii TaxID=301541 RepID=T0FAL1_9LEPT|nr:beta-lactamase [Leptospira broomii serovar Hurstbridge str. 5399]
MDVRVPLISVSTLIACEFFSCSSAPPVRPKEGIRGNSAFVRDIALYKSRERMKSEGIVGLGITIVDGERTVISAGLGKASAENEASENTIFKVGSLSKIFTGIAILQLAENGKIVLDDPAEKYIPELKGLSSRFPDAKPFTIRQLLTHHSGLPSDIFEDWKLSDHSYEKYPYNELPPLLQGIHLTRKPDTAFAYSNLGFSLLGIIVERASGYRFEDYMKVYIFGPAGMKNTSFYDDLPENGKAIGYAGGFWKSEMKVPKIRDIAAGSLSTTPSDMGSFIKALFTRNRYGNKLLTNRSFNEFYAKQNKGIERDLDFEIGLPLWRFKDDKNNLVFAGHGGDLPPFSSYFLLDPERETGIFIVSNTLTSGSTGLEDLAIDLLSLTSEAKSGKMISLPEKTKLQKTPNKDEILSWKRWEGYYASPHGLHKLEIGNKNPNLNLFSFNISLNPLQDGDFVPKLPRLFGFFESARDNLEQFRVSFHEFSGQPALAFSTIRIPRGGILGIAEKVEPYPLPPEWRDRLNLYKPECMDQGDILEKVQFEYDSEAGFILMHLFLKLPWADTEEIFPVKPVDKDSVIILGHGRNLGDTLKFGGDEKGEILYYSGHKMRRIRITSSDSHNRAKNKRGCPANVPLSNLLKNLHFLKQKQKE